MKKIISLLAIGSLFLSAGSVSASSHKIAMVKNKNSISWPVGATAKCNDGTYSYNINHRGSCNHHHGVLIFKQ